MERILRTEVIANAYMLMAKASYKDLSDEDKVRLWKISRLIKPTAVQYIEDKADAMKNLLTPEFSEAFREVQRYKQNYEQGKEQSITPEEHEKYAEIIKQTDTLMEKTIGELADKELTVAFEPLSEEALAKLITGNNWEFSKTGCLEWMLEDN